MTLRSRLAIIVALVVAIAIGSAAAVAHVVTARELHREIDDFLEARADQVAAVVENLPGPLTSGRRQRGPDDELLQTADAVTQLLDRGGRVSVAVEGDPELPVDDLDRRLAAQPGRDRYRTVRVDGTRFRMITQHYERGAIQVGRSLDEVDGTLRRVDARLVLVGIVGTIAAAIAGWVVALRVVAPIQALTRNAERVAATEDLSQAVSVGRSDEVGRLGTAFDRMLGALRLSREQQQRLVQDASHELRTPLTSVRTNLDVLARRHGELGDAERAEIIEAAQTEVRELADLVGELVDHAAGGRVQTEPTQCSLLDIADGVVARFERRSDQAIRIEAPAQVASVVARPDAIERAISNLVGNAIKFSDGSAPVVVSVTSRSVEVLDRGIGIPAEHLDRIFDRFYRPDESRTAPGSGLGLAIVAQVARSHGGRAWARNRDGGGAAIGFDITGEAPTAR